MRRIGFAASLAICTSLTAAISLAQEPDGDFDDVVDGLDNCSEIPNPDQDDSDGCGNLCDCDYDQNGICGFPDFAAFVLAYGSDDEQKCHLEPVPGCTVGFPDFGFLVRNYGSVPGPSGTTPGTVACP